MTIYAGLDVSDMQTHICVVDGEGAVLRRDVAASDPEVLAKWLKKHCAGLVRVVLETGPLSAFLDHGLVERAVPMICICARHAKGVLSTRVNQSDPHDAEGLAQLAGTGWFKPVLSFAEGAVRIKGEATHVARAHLKIREQLVSSRTAAANQLRGLLELFGLRIFPDAASRGCATPRAHLQGGRSDAAPRAIRSGQLAAGAGHPDSTRPGCPGSRGAAGPASACSARG